MAIGTHDEEHQRWWDAKGKLLETVPFIWIKNSAELSPDAEWRRVTFSIDELPKDAGITWEISGNVLGSDADIEPIGNIRSLKYYGQYFGMIEKQETFGLRVGISSGPWRTIHRPRPNGSLSVIGENPMIFSRAFETPQGTSIAVSHSYYDREFRLIAIDKKGVLHVPPLDWTVAGKLYLMRPVFSNLLLDQIDHFEFQTRDYEWVEINDLPAEPNSAHPEVLAP